MLGTAGVEFSGGYSLGQKTKLVCSNKHKRIWASGKVSCRAAEWVFFFYRKVKTFLHVCSRHLNTANCEKILVKTPPVQVVLASGSQTVFFVSIRVIQLRKATDFKQL